MIAGVAHRSGRAPRLAGALDPGGVRGDRPSRPAPVWWPTCSCGRSRRSRAAGWSRAGARSTRPTPAVAGAGADARSRSRGPRGRAGRDPRAARRRRDARRRARRRGPERRPQRPPRHPRAAARRGRRCGARVVAARRAPAWPVARVTDRGRAVQRRPPGLRRGAGPRRPGHHGHPRPVARRPSGTSAPRSSPCSPGVALIAAPWAPAAVVGPAARAGRAGPRDRARRHRRPPARLGPADARPDPAQGRRRRRRDPAGPRPGARAARPGCTPVRPTADATLAAAVAEVAHEVEDLHGTPIDVVVDRATGRWTTAGRPSSGRVRESLLNAVRHGRAARLALPRGRTGGRRGVRPRPRPGLRARRDARATGSACASRSSAGWSGTAVRRRCAGSSTAPRSASACLRSLRPPTDPADPAESAARLGGDP